MAAASLTELSLVRLNGPAPNIEGSMRVAFERDDLFDTRCWTSSEVRASSEWFYPRSLPLLLERFVLGELFEEALEIWDKAAWRASSTP